MFEGEHEVAAWDVVVDGEGFVLVVVCPDSLVVDEAGGAVVLEAVEFDETDVDVGFDCGVELDLDLLFDSSFCFLVELFAEIAQSCFQLTHPFVVLFH